MFANVRERANGRRGLGGARAGAWLLMMTAAATISMMSGRVMMAICVNWSDLHHLQQVAAGGLAGGSVSRVSILIVACGVRRRAIHQRAIHQGALHVERSADGALTTRWPAFELPTVKTWGLALEVMSAHPLHTSEVYRLIAVGVAGRRTRGHRSGGHRGGDPRRSQLGDRRYVSDHRRRAVVQAFLDGAAINHGWVMIGTDMPHYQGALVQIRSSESGNAADAEKRPRLTVEWTLPDCEE